MAKRIGLASLIGVLGLNVWTGSPLLALWIGSRVQGDGPPEMSAIFATIACFAAFSLVLAWLLGRAGAAYDEHTGHVPTVRAHTPWLRSMRGEREHYPGTPPPRLSANERILVGMVMAAVLAFEIWFFFFSGSPIDQRTGR